MSPCVTARRSSSNIWGSDVALLSIADSLLEVERLASAQPKIGAPCLVLLHEGLGSVAMWQDFPRRLADASGSEVIVYSRQGYGRSQALREPRQVEYMHHEALVVLPALLDTLGVQRPLLVGHSDGASIALIHAGGCPRGVSGLVVMAPHVFVEPLTRASIVQAKQAYATTNLPQRLARYHADADHAFWGWNDIWLHPAFQAWNIESYLPTIQAPILAIQGVDDEYGTLDQLQRIARRAPSVKLLELAQCRHSPHRDQPERVLHEIIEFLQQDLV